MGFKHPKKGIRDRHNPYFNRWFSAMLIMIYEGKFAGKSQSLF